MSDNSQRPGGGGHMTGGGPRIDLGGVSPKELAKPIVFGNHQTLFKLFSAAVSAGLVYYMVFRHDYGEKRHCFSWIREWRERKLKDFFHIDPNDSELKQRKEEHTQKHTAENNLHSTVTNHQR